MKLNKEEIRLQCIGANLAVKFEEQYDMPARDRAVVFLTALDMCAYKHKLENADDFIAFKKNVLGEIERVRDIIAEVN